MKRFAPFVWIRISSIALLCATVCLSSHAQAPTPQAAQGWVSTWTAPPDQEGPALKPETIRQIVRTSVGGSQLRLRLSNLFGTRQLDVGAVHVARQAQDATIAPNSDHTVTFGGKKGIVIASGESVLSDAVTLDIARRDALAVSMYLPEGSGPSSLHGLAQQTVYISKGGDSTAAVNFPTDETDDSRYFLTDVEVATHKDTRVIVALGDSTTDGVGSSLDRDTRWTDALLERLQADPTSASIAVVNAGITGNRILNGPADVFVGPSALERFERDVLSKPGVRWIVLLEGVNDITAAGMLTMPKDQVSAQDIIQGMQKLIDRAHAKGLKIYGGTLIPRAEAEGPRRELPEGRVKRQTVNDWIRRSGAFDAVIDFEKAVEDPARSGYKRVEFNNDDKSHPNDAGYRAMAAAVDLGLFAQ
jgi:lysophospholipase L1-like esterase